MAEPQNQTERTSETLREQIAYVVQCNDYQAGVILGVVADWLDDLAGKVGAWREHYEVIMVERLSLAARLRDIATPHRVVGYCCAPNDAGGHGIECLCGWVSEATPTESEARALWAAHAEARRG